MNPSLLQQDQLGDLRGRVSGTVVAADDSGYDEARTIWNGMIDRRPWAVVRAAGAGDVAPTIEFARKYGLDLAVRGGGHNVAGNGTVEDGLVLDLAGLHAVLVDPSAATVRVEAGATLAHIDAATEPHGLVVPIGVVSSTGIAGVTPTRAAAVRRQPGLRAGPVAAGVGGAGGVDAGPAGRNDGDHDDADPAAGR